MSAGTVDPRALTPAEFITVAVTLTEDGFDPGDVLRELFDLMGTWGDMPGTIMQWRRAVAAVSLLVDPSPEHLRELGARVFNDAAMGFGMLTEWASQSTAPSAHRAVGAVIAGHVPDGKPDAPAWPSIKRLAELTGKSESNVKTSIAELVERGELTVEPRKAPNGHGNVYRLRWRGTPESLSTGSQSDVLPTGSQSDTDSLPAGSGSEDVESLLTRGREPADRTWREPADRTGKEMKGKKGTCASAPRMRDELFDALAEACEIDPAELTSSARGAMNRALRDLRAVNATPDEIRARASRHRRKWPEITLTATSLAKHWPELTGGTRRAPAPPRITPARSPAVERHDDGPISPQMPSFVRDGLKRRSRA